MRRAVLVWLALQVFELVLGIGLLMQGVNPVVAFFGGV